MTAKKSAPSKSAKAAATGKPTRASDDRLKKAAATPRPSAPAKATKAAAKAPPTAKAVQPAKTVAPTKRGRKPGKASEVTKAGKQALVEEDLGDVDAEFEVDAVEA
jgi:hypothetical protein